MFNWKPGIRGRGGKPARFNPVLRLVIALAKTLNVDPEELAKNMRTELGKPYAERLKKALDKEVGEEYETAVKKLTE